MTSYLAADPHGARRTFGIGRLLVAFDIRLGLIKWSPNEFSKQQTVVFGLGYCRYLNRPEHGRTWHLTVPCFRFMFAWD